MRRSFVAWTLFAGLALAGCSGGGTTAGGSVSPPTSAPQFRAVPSSVQRSDVQTGLQSLISGQSLVSYGTSGSSSTLVLGRSVKRALARKWTQSVVCQNGFTESIVSTGPNSATVTDQYFYDAACTKLWKNVVASVNLTLGTASGTETIYSSSAVAGGGQTLSLNDSASEYTGALGALTLAQGSGVSWAVNGGSAIDSASGSGTATYAANGLVTAFSINVSDPTYSVVLAVNGNSTGASGSLTQGSSVLASFTLDTAGDGAISFANGSQEQVRGYFITT
jgi:hypothetical protein